MEEVRKRNSRLMPQSEKESRPRMEEVPVAAVVQPTGSEA